MFVWYSHRRLRSRQQVAHAVSKRRASVTRKITGRGTNGLSSRETRLLGNTL